MHWATIITSTGALLGGLAIVLAFIQLGGQREDRLRAQISKIGVWAETPEPSAAILTGREVWHISMDIRNASELPVLVPEATLTVEAKGRRRAAPKTDSTPGPSPADPGENFEESSPTYFTPGTIAPGSTWQEAHDYRPPNGIDHLEALAASITDATVIDSAGLQWEIRSYRAGPPRRIGWWRRWQRARRPARVRAIWNG